MQRTRITARAALRLQLDILRVIARSERRIRRLRESIAANRVRLSSAGTPRLQKPEAALIKDRIQRDWDTVERNRWAVATVQSIADGLAFSVLPKWDIKPLSFKEEAGFVSGKAGLRNELRMLRAIASGGRIAVMNDLTNCLRFGDITIPGNPAPVIVEVKSSEVENSRSRKQYAKAREVAEYLSKDKSENWRGTGTTVIRRPLHSPERHHRRLLAPLVNEARRVGHGIRWPEPGLCYCCLSATSVQDVLESLRPKFKVPPMAYPLFPARTLPSYYYPLTLSLADPDAWWSVVSGETSIVVFLDPTRLNVLGRSVGIEFTIIEDDEWLWEVTPNPPDGSAYPFRISGQFFGRLCGEFLNLKWFVEEVASRSRLASTEAEGDGGASEDAN